MMMKNILDRILLRKRPIAWAEKIFQNPLPEIVDFEKNHHYFSSHPLIGKVSTGLKDTEIVQTLLLTIEQKITHSQERSFCTAEIITKVLAYRDLHVGQQIAIPLIDEKGKNVLVTYEVDAILNLLSGMPAFGLMPKQPGGVPILLFRGTDFTLSTKRGWASVLSDLDLRGPGRTTFLYAREAIRNWLISAKDRAAPARVMGFSLGGVLTMYTLLYENELINQDPHFPSYAFHPPGLNRKLSKEWDKTAHAKFLVISHKNDLVPKIGELVGNIYQVSSKKPLFGIFAHLELLSSQMWINMDCIYPKKKDRSSISS